MSKAQDVRLRLGYETFVDQKGAVVGVSSFAGLLVDLSKASQRIRVCARPSRNCQALYLPHLSQNCWRDNAQAAMPCHSRSEAPAVFAEAIRTDQGEQLVLQHQLL